jgi:hypothetical protein
VSVLNWNTTEPKMDLAVQKEKRLNQMSIHRVFPAATARMASITISALALPARRIKRS